jgi:hypothetical protein
MSRKIRIVRSTLCLVLLGLLATLPAFAGSAVIGSVAGSMNATVGGQTLLPNTTLFSGDSLQVKDGLAVVALGSASRIVLGRDTVASFLRDSNEVTVLLGQGNVSVFHDADGMPVRMKIGDVSVVPVSGFKTLGEVAMLNGSVVVTAKEGMLRVEGNGPAINVAKGKTITVVPRTSAPQNQPGGNPPGAGRMGGGNTYLDAGALGAGIVAAILAGLAESRAGDAKTDATDAASAAAAAAAAASAAVAAANSAAAASAAAANAVGCALNVLANEEGQASPYTPPAGETCSGGLGAEPSYPVV